MNPLNRTTADIAAPWPVKVLQFGEGNFLRAFADWAVDIMNERAGFNGSVLMIQPIQSGMTELINKQDGLYHLILNGIRKGEATSETRLITSVAGAVNPYEDFDAFLKTAEIPSVEFIISNTTEAGIAFDEKDKNPDVLPSSFPGKLTVLLHHRFKHFHGDATKAPVVIPCELIDKNGTNLRATVFAYIEYWQLDVAFKQWVADHVVFCNTLVDRIVPGFPRNEIQQIQQRLGYEDNLVVTAEPFHLWVIEAPQHVEAKFPAVKAGLDVKFVADQSPYRTRKVRILNGAHTAMVPVAYLRGLRTVKESIDDSHMNTFVKAVIFNEIIPTLELPKAELTQFAEDVIERFQNPFIRHDLMSIALNSVSKFKVRVLPSILEYHSRFGQWPTHLAHAMAALIVFYRGEYNGTAIPLNDTPEVLAFMKESWEHSAETAVNRVLSNTSFWDADLTEFDGFETLVTQFARHLLAVDVTQH